MDAYSDPAEHPRKSQKMLQSEPWMIYVTAGLIGVGCSSVFPAISSLVEQKGLAGLSRTLPHVYSRA